MIEKFILNDARHLSVSLPVNNLMNTIKYNFVIDCKDSELPYYINLERDNAVQIFSRGDLCWCLQTYLILLKRANLQVQCSNHLQHNAINIIHSDQLLKIKGSHDKFIICIRADYPKRSWAHYHIVQNQNQLHSNTSFIPHWIQPGIIKRNSLRQGVSKVVYSGQPFNGNLAGSEEAWKKLFKSHNIEFKILSAGSWHDLSSVDVLIAIRSFDKKPHNTKPPSKLFNAWHACIPFVGGYDSAFMQVGTPGKDFLLAKTPKEVISAVLKLKNEPGLYEKIVKNGLRKTALYNETTIAECWEDMLINIVSRYEKWRSHSLYERLRFNTLLRTSIIEHKSKQFIKKIIGRK